MPASETSLIANHINARGRRHFHDGRYLEAERDFRQCLARVGGEDPLKPVYMLDLANACQMSRKYDEADSLYGQLMSNGKTPQQLRDFAHDELQKLSVRRQRPLPEIKGDPPRLRNLGDVLIPSYQLVKRPINLVMVNESSDSLSFMEQLQDQHNVPEASRIRGFEGWTAVGHIIGDEHWIFVKRNHWEHATDQELIGLLSHEFVHEELKDTENAYAVDPRASPLALICNERATDIIAIGKGFGRELLASRLYSERISGTFEHQKALMSPQEIADLIESPAYLMAEADFQSKFAASLGQELGPDSPVVREEFDKAVPLWHRVTDANPDYAHGQRELAVAHWWSGSITDAIRHARLASEIDPENEQYQMLVRDLGRLPSHQAR